MINDLATRYILLGILNKSNYKLINKKIQSNWISLFPDLDWVLFVLSVCLFFLLI